MTRIITYNILLGGTHRVEPLLRLLQAGQSELIGLVEASDHDVVRKLAAQLGMDYRMSGPGESPATGQAALLSRLPIRWSASLCTPLLAKQPLLEVGVEEPDGSLLTVCLIHQTAAFSKWHRANEQRRREVQELLRLLASLSGTPHLLLGDFNSLAPREHASGSAYLSYVTKPHLYHQLLPAQPGISSPLNAVLPRRLRFLRPLLQAIPRSSTLSALFDALDRLYAPRGGIDLLLQAGYVDCFRRLHPTEPGYTWPTALPAGRIDFIFASPEVSPRLVSCEILTAGKGIPASQASDHFPLLATFRSSTSVQES